MDCSMMPLLLIHLIYVGDDSVSFNDEQEAGYWMVGRSENPGNTRQGRG